MKKKWIAILLIALTMVAGCWNRKELNRLAIVLGTAVDCGKDSEVHLTVQIVKPGQVQVAGGGGGGGDPTKATLVLTAQGRTMLEAVRNFLAQSSRKPFFSHNQIIIFGEELSKKGLTPVLDWFERDPEPRSESLVFVAQGKAADILKLPGELEITSALGISESMNDMQYFTKSMKVTLHDFMQNYSSKTTAGVMPQVKLVKSSTGQEYRIEGLGVFHNGKLVGQLDDVETRGFLWINGKIKGGTLVIDNPQNKEQKISMEVMEVKTKIKAQWVKGRPEIIVQIRERANIDELTGALDITKPQIIKAIEQEQAKVIKQEVEKSVRKTKKLKADIYGFGEALHRANPQAWKQIKSRWNDEFTHLTVKVQVEPQLRRIGEKIQATTPK